MPAVRWRPLDWREWDLQSRKHQGGEFGKNGQLNLVQFKKRVLSALSRCLINSYYLLIMKIEQRPDGYVPHVYLVDMLDFLDFTGFASGPGQRMLREALFYSGVDEPYEEGRHPVSRVSLTERASRPFEVLEAADPTPTLERDRECLTIEASRPGSGYREPDEISRASREIGMPKSQIRIRVLFGA